MPSEPANPSSPTSAPSVTSTLPPTLPNALPSDLSSLIALFLSFSALRDWLKLLVIGGFFETCRRLLFSLWYTIINSFWITVEFEEGDDSFDWVMVWLSQQPSWTSAREIAISTRSYGLNSTAVLIPGEEKNDCSGSERKLAYLPSFDTSYTLWYKRHYIRVSRSKRQESIYSHSETLTLKIFAQNHLILDTLLLEAKKTWHQAKEHSISIYVSDSTNNWRHITSRPKRPLQSIVLDDGIKELLLDDARDFLDSKTWYSDRGIPFRRGYLLHGAPGSGKTSMIHSLAGELGLDVYVVSLSRTGLDDSSLQELISDLPEKCIALMEDIDAAFHHGITRNHSEDTEKMDPSKPSPQAEKTSSRISLSGLLNALDGLGAQEGRMLFATTNQYHALDAALCRPGRMDLHVEFKLASKYQARELFKCFYMPAGFKEDEAKDDDDQSVDSGYGTPLDDKLVDVDSSVEKADVSFVGASHKIKAPRLSSAQVKELAAQFADAIPERRVSMAALQGYLMFYKARPFEAIRCAEKWVEEQKKAKSSV